ncbi:MAG: cache domain-containing protein [Candidatus Daviesbacteria bacterium]|nr:cache domain-containing protein [Candidatus Daviesbacteria bacterium]
MIVFRRILSDWILWLGMFSIIVLGGAFYLVLGRGIESSVTEQILRQEQIISRAEASNISSFFQTFGNLVVVLSQLSSIEARDVNAVRDLDTFVKQQYETGFIGGVVLTDKNGVVQFNSNVLGTRDVGGSIADRDYFIWAKTEGEKGKYFISEPVVSQMGATKGTAIVVVAAPVYQNGAFTGVIAAAVKLESLTNYFFGLMKISDLTEVYLIDEHGKLLYSHAVPQQIGSNISELFSGNQPLVGSIKNALSGTEEGKLQTETHLIAYSPVILGTQIPFRKW